MITTKRNLVKVKTLLFLRIRKKAGREWAGALEIARAIEGSNHSLYVLLARWCRWHLTQRRDGAVYRYRITGTGQRYLDNLERWYASDEDVKDLASDIATAMQLIFWWRDEKQPERIIYHIKAPFQAPEDFIIDTAPAGYRYSGFTARPGQIAVECEGPVEAYHGLLDYWVNRGRPMGDAMVDAKIGMVWAKEPTLSPG